jgi:hypothetical protein
MSEITYWDQPAMLKVGHWREMKYDAEVEVDGLRWLRAHGGFGDGQDDREDWVLALDEVGSHVKRWKNQQRWEGRAGDFDTMEEAMRAAIPLEAHYTEQKLMELKDEVERMQHSLDALNAAARRAP